MEKLFHLIENKWCYWKGDEVSSTGVYEEGLAEKIVLKLKNLQKNT